MKLFKKILLWLGLSSLVLIPVAAWASIPDSSGTIHGCRLNLTGLVRVIDSPSQSCTILETPISWPSSDSSYTPVVTLRDERTITFFNANETIRTTLGCNADEEAIGVFFAQGVVSGWAFPTTSGKNGPSHWDLSLRSGAGPTQYVIAVECLST